jgi:carboxymethylenebutenolidase
MVAYLAAPDGDGPHRAVVVIHEAYGLNDDIRRIAERLATEGYVAVAPDLVEGGRLGCLAQAMRALRSGEGPMVDRATQVVGWLDSRPDVIPGRIGVIGFCLGGGFAFVLGMSGMVRAAAPQYGQPPGDLSRLDASCPVVASYGGRDKVFGKYADLVRARLTSAGVACDIEAYPDAGHSFMNDAAGHTVVKVVGRPFMATGYHHQSAEHAWSRILDFFDEHV